MPGKETDTSESLILHASCVALGDRALLLTGSSGRGKSTLALQLMAYGATLVADDRTLLRAQSGQLLASCPPGIRGLIEMRGLGVLKADVVGERPLAAVVDLDQEENARLPERLETRILGITLPLILRVDCPSFAAGLLQYLKKGRYRP